MRIAYLTQSYPPMISDAALDVEGLAKAIAERGHEVLVIAAGDTGQIYRIEDGKLTVVRLQSLHNPPSFCLSFELVAYLCYRKSAHFSSI